MNAVIVFYIIYTNILYIQKNYFLPKVYVLLHKMFKAAEPVLWYLITTCSSAPRCDSWAPPAVWAPTRDPSSTELSRLGFHLSWRSSQWIQNWDFFAGENHPGPFFQPLCSSLFLCIPLHRSLNLPASSPDPPCSQRCRSHWEGDSPQYTWYVPWLRLHAVKPAAGGQSQRLGRGFPDAGSGTSTI